eukprot:252185-Amorphochlora_amoeboformis.AAC.1
MSVGAVATVAGYQSKTEGGGLAEGWIGTLMGTACGWRALNRKAFGSVRSRRSWRSVGFQPACPVGPEEPALDPASDVDTSDCCPVGLVRILRTVADRPAQQNPRNLLCTPNLDSMLPIPVGSEGFRETPVGSED